MLLQVDSDDNLSMDWAGGGVIQYCIRKDELAKRDFAGVWLTMQFL